MLALEYISGEAHCFGRTGVHLHGGRPSAKELKSTHGCIRISDGDILELKELISWLVSNDNEEKAGYLYVENNLDNPVDYSDKSEVQSALSYDGGELDPAVIEPGYYTFPLSLKFKYLDEQFKQRHED